MTSVEADQAGTLSLPALGFDLDQYRTQAKELLKLARAADPQSLERIRTHHPEHGFVTSTGEIKLADTQLVIARELGFGSWAKLKEELLFRKAVHLLDTGQAKELGDLLKQHPDILTYRCYRGDWYEEGYFKGATLLNHIAGNPIRCPLPQNIVEVTRILLTHGVDPNIATDTGSTTIGLLLTGKQVADAGVGVTLIEIIKAAGAKDDIEHGDVLSAPLWNAGRATAEELVRRGAKMDLRHAAALGRIDAMEELLTAETSPDLIEEALIYASHQGEEGSARWLINHDAKGDVLIKATGAMPDYAARATALHMAAWAGHARIVRLLLDHGADATVIEPTYHGTALGWAEHGGHEEIAAMLRDALAKTGHEPVTFNE